MTDPAVVGTGIGARLVDVGAALARRDSFVAEGQETAPTDPGADDDTSTAAVEFVLRALRTSADPTNHRLLTRLAEGDTSLAALCRHLGLPRTVTWERVNDLVQSGLVGRSVEHDRIGLAPAGAELVAFVAAAATSTVEHTHGRSS